MPRKNDEVLESEYQEEVTEEVPEFVPEDEFAKPSEINNEELSKHQPGAARPREVKLAVAPGNPHGHDDTSHPPDTLTPSLPENRPVKTIGPWGGIPPVEMDQELLNSIQDPYNERNPKKHPDMVVVKDSYGNNVLTPV